jgi:phage tail-like protein
MPDYPYIESSFFIELSLYNGNPLASFSGITGGSMSIVVVEYTHLYDEGNSAGIYIPSATSFEPITLSLGVTDDLQLWRWWYVNANGERDRRNLTLKARGTNGDEAEWTLEDAWPSRISGFNFDASSNKYFLASVTLVVENIIRVGMDQPIS